MIDFETVWRETDREARLRHPMLAGTDAVKNSLVGIFLRRITEATSAQLRSLREEVYDALAEVEKTVEEAERRRRGVLPALPAADAAVPIARTCYCGSLMIPGYPCATCKRKTP